MEQRNLALALAAIASLGVVSAAFAQDAAQPKPGDAAALVAQTGDPDGAFVMSARFSEPDGEKLYRRVCAACHMADASGARGAGVYPALAKNPKLASGAYPLYVVMKGLNGMPPLGDMMTDQQAADVVNYIRTHFGNKYKDAVKPADAKALR